MLMYWKIIAMPLVGAVIGYVTNWIAVKMLFRPRKEILLCGKRLPFTPGVIPKGQKRLARAVGQAVEKQLLTKDVLEEVLLSEEKMDQVRAFSKGWMEKQKASEETVRQVAERVLPEESVDDFIFSAEEKMTKKIFDKIKDMEPGKMIAEEVLRAAKAKLEESMFGAMLGSSFLEPIAKQAEEFINDYIKEKGRPFVEKMVAESSEDIQNKTTGELIGDIEKCHVDIPVFAAEQYSRLVKENLPGILRMLDISSIVEDKINVMDVEEVEELMLSIMKKELGAVVNLGALIGLLLGLINAAILYL